MSKHRVALLTALFLVLPFGAVCLGEVLLNSTVSVDAEETCTDVQPANGAYLQATEEDTATLEMPCYKPDQHDGMLGTVNLMNWGPDGKREHGDAYTPLYANSPNPYWPESEGVYSYRIHVPSDYPESVVRVELFDPDCFNVQNSVASPQIIQHSKTTDTRNVTIGGDRADAVVLDQSDWDPSNPYWFVRIDENRCSYGEACFSPGSGSRDTRYDASYNTTTSYHLFYYTKLSDGTIVSRTLATYIKGGLSADSDTDMKWVCPGGSLTDRDPAVTYGPGTFEVNIDDLKNDPVYPIYVDPDDGHVSLYLDVEGISGSSENGWDLWAGPVYAAVPANVNERNIDIVNRYYALDPKGVLAYALGHLPRNVNVNDELFTTALAYIEPEMGDMKLSVAHFDNDAITGTEHICYTFSTMPWQDWFRLGTLSGDDHWFTDTFQIPSPPTHTFYGGYLEATYFGGYQDSSVWNAEARGTPLDTKEGCDVYPIGVSRWLLDQLLGGNKYFRFDNTDPGDIDHFAWFYWGCEECAESQACPVTLAEYLSHPTLDPVFSKEQVSIHIGDRLPGFQMDIPMPYGAAGCSEENDWDELERVMDDHVDTGRTLLMVVFDHTATRDYPCSFCDEYRVVGFVTFRIDSYNIEAIAGHRDRFHTVRFEHVGGYEACGQPYLTLFLPQILSGYLPGW
jgi:hypothetical protein